MGVGVSTNNQAWLQPGRLLYSSPNGNPIPHMPEARKLSIELDTAPCTVAAISTHSLPGKLSNGWLHLLLVSSTWREFALMRNMEGNVRGDLVRGIWAWNNADSSTASYRGSTAITPPLPDHGNQNQSNKKQRHKTAQRPHVAYFKSVRLRFHLEQAYIQGQSYPYIYLVSIK